jgi:hypothetical protein
MKNFLLQNNHLNLIKNLMKRLYSVKAVNIICWFILKTDDYLNFIMITDNRKNLKFQNFRKIEVYII